MFDEIILATDEALREVAVPRFMQTERGFQGRFYCALQQSLDKRGLFQGEHILEMEYQKSSRHGTSQRPDIVLHIPAEEGTAKVSENNLAVWALKRHATSAKARDDFAKLDKMFELLCYPVGIFINIDARDHFATSYKGRFPDRFRAVAVWLDSEATTCWGFPEFSKA